MARKPIRGCGLFLCLMLTEEEISSFIEITKKEKGIELSREEAMMQGTKLIQLFELMYSAPDCHLVNENILYKDHTK